MTIRDVIDGIREFDEGLTIYAAEPWTQNSQAIVTTGSDYIADPPPEAAASGLTYMLEVFDDCAVGSLARSSDGVRRIGGITRMSSGRKRVPTSTGTLYSNHFGGVFCGPCHHIASKPRSRSVSTWRRIIF